MSIGLKHSCMINLIRLFIRVKRDRSFEFACGTVPLYEGGNLMSGSLNTPRQFATPVLGLLLMTSAAVAQSTRARPGPPRPQELKGKVTSVKLRYVRTGRETRCPANFPGFGAITTDGPADVKYTWVSSDGRSWPEHTLTFRGAGSKNASMTWHVGKPGEKVDVWLQLKVISPNEVLSKRSTFVVSCIK